VSIFNAAPRLTAPIIAGFLCLAVTGVRAQTVVVENVSLGSQGFRIEIPRIEAEGSNLSREAIQALFDGAQTGSLAARLGGWSAASVRMPELRYRQTLPNPGGAATDQVVTYTNLVLSGLQSGTAQRFALDGATSTAGNALVGEITTRMGAARAQDFDLGAAAAFFTRAAGPNEPLRRVYRDFAFDGMQVTGG